VSEPRNDWACGRQRLAESVEDVKLLALDHYSLPDLQSLRDAAGGQAQIRALPYEFLSWEALQIFPPAVSTRLEAFASPEYEVYRARYATRLNEILEEQFVKEQFDAFVAPSDIFYYIRAAREACHRLGVPFFVVEKETTLTEHDFRTLPRKLHLSVPPVADRRTVCSERMRDLWVRSGADPQRVTVTGQPRFDYYAHPERWPGTAPFGDGGPVVLFLSYLPHAYQPESGETWETLHKQSEEALWELATRGWRVLVKPHPQQDFETEHRRMRREGGSLVGERVFLLQANSDVRPLIATSDVVLGFQTTALFEAMIAEKPVVFTGWDEVSQRASDELIRFWDWPEALEVVDRPDRLVETVERAREWRSDAGVMDARRRIFAEQLGPCDGAASLRALACIRQEVERFAAARSATTVAHREEVIRRKPRPQLGRRVRRGASRARRLVRLRTRARSLLRAVAGS